MKNTTVLIVEDEILVAENLKTVLEKNGLTVAGMAVSGESAIEKALEIKPGLILMDIILKGDIDGIEAAAKIRESISTPVVFLTAHSDFESIDRSKEADPFGYLTKPFDDRQLIISIEMALYKHKIDQEKEQLIEDLHKALDKVEVLSGLLPICSYCKNIRDDRGYWEKVEDYMRSRSNVEFTHSICPSCMKIHYPEIDIDD